MIFASAILCTAMLTQGVHAIECKAEYLHTINGVRYWDEAITGYFVINQSSAECSGEGHPVRVTMKDLGSVVCRTEVMLFSDGFEDGTTDAWISQPG